MFCLKYICMWLLANYSYDNILKTYNSYYSENTFGDMVTFIKDQQFREDQLREKCNLHYYKIKQHKTNYENIKDTFNDILNYSKGLLLLNVYKNLIPDLNYPIPHIYLPMEPIEVTNLTELYKVSYVSSNIHKDILYNDVKYNLIKVGLKEYYCSYSNQYNCPSPQKPVWTIELGNHTLTITDIK